MALTLIIIIAVAAVFFGGLFFIFKKKQDNKDSNGQGLLLLQNQISEIGKTLDSKLGESSKVLDSKLAESARMLQHQFGESSRMIKEITVELTKVNEGQKQVVGFADQLKSLQDILKNPKQRGLLGEYYLETTLKNVMSPGSYKMQYSFSDGTIVDAVIFIREKLVPVDSKFSLENYNRLIETRDEGERKRLTDVFRNDLKTRIEETAQYIKPNENTMDFAFMFIPSEAVYYDLLVNKVGAIKEASQDLIQYAARDKKVLIVSPTTFHAYLQTVMQGLKALEIEESAKIIKKRVEELGRHLSSYEVYMKKLGSHLGTAVNSYNSAYKELGKIDKDVMRITEGSPEIKPEMLDKPQIDI